MTTPKFLLTCILFCSVLLTSHADHDDILTEEDVRAFEEAVVERRPQGAFGILMGETKVLEKRQSSRVRKVNAARGQLQQSNRKRGRQRSLLRRSGIEPLLTSNRRRVLRKRKRRPSTGRGGGDDRGILTQTRILGKSEPTTTERPQQDEEKSIENAVLQALEEATTTASTTREMSPLRMTPPRRGDSFIRTSTPSSQAEEAITAPLDDLIAALEGIEAPQFLDVPTTEGTTEGTPTLTTTTANSDDLTTTEPKTTIEALLLVRSTSDGVGEAITLPPSRLRPIQVPSVDEEAQKLSDEIERNFIEPAVLQPPEEETPAPPIPPQEKEGEAPAAPPHEKEVEAPAPPLPEALPEAPAPPPSDEAPPPRRGVPSPPGEQPPSDSVVSELNTADDFLAVAKRLRLFRRRQAQL